MAGRGPARSGRRNAALLEPPAPADEVVAASKVIYVCGARPLRVGELVVQPGVEIPGVDDWARPEAWLNARRIRKISVDDKHISFADFQAWAGRDVETEGDISLEDFVAGLEADRLADEQEAAEADAKSDTPADNSAPDTAKSQVKTGAASDTPKDTSKG